MNARKCFMMLAKTFWTGLNVRSDWQGHFHTFGVTILIFLVMHDSNLSIASYDQLENHHFLLYHYYFILIENFRFLILHGLLSDKGIYPLPWRLGYTNQNLNESMWRKVCTDWQLILIIHKLSYQKPEISKSQKYLSNK